MRDVPKEAAYFREALWLGMASVGDVVSWSDSIIEESSRPDAALVEISCMHKAHPLDVLHVLEFMSQGISTVEALPEVLGRAHAKLVADPRCGRALARGLYGVFVRCDYGVPEELRDIGWFDDAFDLAEQGVYGSVDDVQAALVRFMAQFACG